MSVNHFAKINHYKLKISIFKALLNHQLMYNGLTDDARSYEMAIIFYQSKIDTLLNRAIVYASPS